MQSGGGLPILRETAVKGTLRPFSTTIVDFPQCSQTVYTFGFHVFGIIITGVSLMDNYSN